jgi:hypothetical protein
MDDFSLNPAELEGSMRLSTKNNIIWSAWCENCQNESNLRDPDQRALGQQIAEWKQVSGGQMNAAMGDSPAESQLVGNAVNVNVTGLGIHIIAAIKSRLQALEPKDAMHNGCLGFVFPDQSNRLPVLKSCALRMASANFLRDAVKPERSLVRICSLANTVARC